MIFRTNVLGGGGYNVAKNDSITPQNNEDNCQNLQNNCALLQNEQISHNNNRNKKNNSVSNKRIINKDDSAQTTYNECTIVKNCANRVGDIMQNKMNIKSNKNSPTKLLLIVCFFALSLLLCFSTFMPVYSLVKSNVNALYSGGSGTESDPYLISTYDDFCALSTNVANGETYDSKYFLLTNNITTNATTWTIIGYFAGIFDGGGNTLTFTNEVTFTNIRSGNTFSGFFYTAKEIKNFGLNYSGGVNFNKADYCGGMVAVDAIVSQCFTTGYIYGSDSRLGGISYSASSITNCYSTAFLEIQPTQNLQSLNLEYDNKSDLPVLFAGEPVAGSESIAGLNRMNTPAVVSSYFAGDMTTNFRDRRPISGYATYGEGITNCYYISNSNYTSFTSQGTELTAAQMQGLNNFTGFDTSVWTIKSGENNGFPVLKVFYKESKLTIDFDDGTESLVITQEPETTYTLPDVSTRTKVGYKNNGLKLITNYGSISADGKTYTFGSGDDTIKLIWTELVQVIVTLQCKVECNNSMLLVTILDANNNIVCEKGITTGQALNFPITLDAESTYKILITKPFGSVLTTSGITQISSTTYSLTTNYTDKTVTLTLAGNGNWSNTVVI